VLAREVATPARAAEWQVHIDELYDACWVAAALDFGPDFPRHRRPRADRRLAGRTRRTDTPCRGPPEPRRDGQLQWYLAMAILGLVGSLTWMWAHG
jgi:hypothetical protein